MKKILLFISLFLCSAILGVYAYETIIIKFPDRELWVKGYYKKIGNEAILQYVPGGQTSENWTRTIVVHSYKDSNFPINVFAGAIYGILYAYYFHILLSGLK